MFDIPTIMTSDEILDKAFRRSNKVQVSDPDYRFRMMKLNTSKLDSFTSIIDSVLSGYVRAFPSFDNLPEFYRALIDLLFSVDDLKKALGRVEGARREITSISAKTIKQIRRTKNPSYMENKRREANGRISSIVKELNPALLFLNEVKKGMRNLPSIPTKHPTAVIAGAPNVGKSRLIASISTADPKVASYPFTSQELSVGYFEHKRRRMQLVDTPGLLDRPFDERNDIEKQAVLALTLLTDLCIYIIDPTETCGSSLGTQVSLLSSLKESIPEMNYLVVIGKSDLEVPDHVDGYFVDGVQEMLGDSFYGVISVSAESGEGLDELLNWIGEHLSGEKVDPGFDPYKDI